MDPVLQGNEGAQRDWRCLASTRNSRSTGTVCLFRRLTRRIWRLCVHPSKNETPTKSTLLQLNLEWHPCSYSQFHPWNYKQPFLSPASRKQWWKSVRFNLPMSNFSLTAVSHWPGFKVLPAVSSRLSHQGLERFRTIRTQVSGSTFLVKKT